MKTENFVLSTMFQGFLTKSAFEKAYNAYFEQMKENPLKPFSWESTTDFIEKVKRDREAKSVGPYRNISLFEIANRIYSDLVVLEGAKRIFEGKEFDARKLEISLSTKGGFDIVVQCANGKYHLCEAFNVAQSFLGGKLYLTKRGFSEKRKENKWLKEKNLEAEVIDKRIIIFNEGMRYAPDTNYHILQVPFKDL